MDFVFGLVIGLVVGGFIIWMFKRNMKTKAKSVIDHMVSANKMSEEVAKVIRSVLGIT